MRAHQKLIDEAQLAIHNSYAFDLSQRHERVRFLLATLASQVDHAARLDALRELARLIWVTAFTSGPAPWERNWEGRDEGAEAWKQRIVGLVEMQRDAVEKARQDERERACKALCSGCARGIPYDAEKRIHTSASCWWGICTAEVIRGLSSPPTPEGDGKEKG